MLALIYVPLLAEFFSFAPPTLSQWALLALCPLIMLLAEEGRAQCLVLLQAHVEGLRSGRRIRQGRGRQTLLLQGPQVLARGFRPPGGLVRTGRGFRIALGPGNGGGRGTRDQGHEQGQ